MQHKKLQGFFVPYKLAHVKHIFSVKAYIRSNPLTMKDFLKQWWLLFALIVFQSVVSVAIAWYGGFSHVAYRASVTFTMRYCTVVFCFTYMARGLHLIFRNKATKALLANRKILGIAFTYSFLFHLCELAFLHTTITMSPFMFGLQLIPIAFINLMGFTSIPVVQRNMSGKLWKLIHQWGSVVIWLALFKNYILIFFIPSLLGDRTIFYAGTFLVGITPLVRLYLIYRKSQSQKPTLQPAL